MKIVVNNGELVFNNANVATLENGTINTHEGYNQESTIKIRSVSYIKLLKGESISIPIGTAYRLQILNFTEKAMAGYVRDESMYNTYLNGDGSLSTVTYKNEQNGVRYIRFMISYNGTDGTHSVNDALSVTDYGTTKLNYVTSL